MTDHHGKSGLFKGSHFEPTQFDIDLLKIMPDEGATRGRYMPDYLTVTQIKRALDPSLTSGFVSTRLRMMRNFDLVVRVGSRKGAGGWQRTAQGRELVERKVVNIKRA